MYASVPIHLCKVFTVPFFFIIAKGKWKQPKSPSIGNKVKKIHVMKFHVAVKVNELELDTRWWKNNSTIKLRVKRKLQMNSYRRIL